MSRLEGGCVIYKGQSEAVIYARYLPGSVRSALSTPVVSPIVEPKRTPLAYGAEDVLGLSLAGFPRAGRVVVRHVGPSAGLV